MGETSSTFLTVGNHNWMCVNVHNHYFVLKCPNYFCYTFTVVRKMIGLYICFPHSPSPHATHGFKLLETTLKRFWLIMNLILLLSKKTYIFHNKMFSCCCGPNSNRSKILMKILGFLRFLFCNGCPFLGACLSYKFHLGVRLSAVLSW